MDLAARPRPWTEARSNFSRTWPDAADGGLPGRAGRGGHRRRSTSSGRRCRTPPSTSSRSAPRPTSRVGTFETCRTAGTTYTPGMFAINTTGIPSTSGRTRTATRRRGDQLLAGARAWTGRSPSPVTSPASRASSPRPRPSSTSPASITNMSPRGGATVDVPTLTWEPVVGRRELRHRSSKRNGSARRRHGHHLSTSYTMDGTTQLDPADNPYTWRSRRSTTEGISSRRTTPTPSTSRAASPTRPAPALTPLTPTQSRPGHP